jgi:hypothetical protein
MSAHFLFKCLIRMAPLSHQEKNKPDRIKYKQERYNNRCIKFEVQG